MAQTDTQKMKAKISQDIYNKIANTARDSRKQPTFNFLYSKGEPYYNAYYDPSNHTINLGEGIYDIASTFGADSTNALALVLGHELAHFYKDHGWGYSFGTKSDYMNISEKIYKLQFDPTRKAEMEAQADYYGGIFTYMAGYNTLAIGPEFFDKFYGIAQIPDVTSGYPTKQERMKICANSKKMLEDLVPVFEAANYLVLLGEYEKAANLYDHIIVTFPSREMYNNEGCALALAALGLSPEQTKFVYPFTIDTDTRLNNAGTKGLTEDPETKRKRLLEEAKDAFMQAMKLDKDYVPAYLNLALVYELQGEKELAEAMASKAFNMAQKNADDIMMANASIAKGIVLATAKRNDEAKTEFKKAFTGNKKVAQINLDVLNNPDAKGMTYKPDVSGEKTSTTDEAIASVSASLLETLFEDAKEVVIAKQNKEKPSLKVYSVYDPEYTAIMVKTVTYPSQTVSFIYTNPKYNGTSGRGIKHGTKVSKLIDAYGQPGRIIMGTDRTYYIFEKTPVIFTTDKKDNVTNWILYVK
jgi:tetratricopeptide (TPR) repeat protein